MQTSRGGSRESRGANEDRTRRHYNFINVIFIDSITMSAYRHADAGNKPLRELKAISDQHSEARKNLSLAQFIEDLQRLFAGWQEKNPEKSKRFLELKSKVGRLEPEEAVELELLSEEIKRDFLARYNESDLEQDL